MEHFGGTWIDATVLLTGKIPEYILESDFFAFRDTFGLIENPATISNWLLHSVPHNIILKEAIFKTSLTKGEFSTSVQIWYDLINYDLAQANHKTSYEGYKNVQNNKQITL